MDEVTQGFLTQIWAALDGTPESLAAMSLAAEGDLESAFPVTSLACASIGSAGLAISSLVAEIDGGRCPDVIVDRRLASFWFAWSIRPIDWEPPGPWDAVAGDYRASDGWIRLHTNAPHHREAALGVLGEPADRERVAAAVQAWPKSALESAIVAAGGCAAEMSTADEWLGSEQGAAVAAEPLMHLERISESEPAVRSAAWQPTRERPLEGLRVLDLTRVLAGPVATRFLAGYGAEVLRIDPPDWDEPGVVPEVTLGKRCARLDLKTVSGRERFEALLARADILLHGYRPGALDGLGYDAARRQAIAPGLVDVCLSAYGWTGPWRQRRGFDSLVQMSAGIADAGMRWRKADKPVPLPVQALDHATGYMLAAAAVMGVRNRLRDDGRGTRGRLSLARTAGLLTSRSPAPEGPGLTAESAADLAAGIERTDWGQARRLEPPVDVAATPMRWSRPASDLGTADAAWSD